MVFELLQGEKILNSFSGSKVEAKSMKEWLFKRAMTVGMWHLTNKRLVFEGEKPNPFFTLIMSKLPPEFYPLDQIAELKIVPWMEVEETLEIKMRNGESVLLRLQWQTREKLEEVKKLIEETLKNLQN